MTLRRIVPGVLCLAMVLLIGGVTSPAIGRAAEASPKEEALKWIDGFRKQQVLFHEKDVDRLRQEIADGTDDEAQEWLNDTKEIRAALDGPKWKETRRWLKEFLQVQAIYSDKQISEFRDEAQAAAKESPQKFEEILAQVEKDRARLSSGAAQSTQQREQKLAVVEAFQQEATAQREATRRAAAEAAASAPQTTPQPVTPKNYRRPPQLIDSLDVARWSIMNNFWRRR